jgi:hypothetical protein
MDQQPVAARDQLIDINPAQVIRFCVGEMSKQLRGGMLAPALRPGVCSWRPLYQEAPC